MKNMTAVHLHLFTIIWRYLQELMLRSKLNNISFLFFTHQREFTANQLNSTYIIL